MSNIYYWEKLMLSKLVRESKFLGTKIWRNALPLKSKKVQDIFGEIIILAILSSAVICLQNYLRFLLIRFAWEIKDFHQSSSVRDIMNISPNILAKIQNFKKLRHGFVDERALMTTIFISSCHWKTLVYLFAYERKDLKTHF